MCQSGSIAVISDAGTPLISDPGFQLVEQARAMGFAVLSIPGPSAVTAALSICPFSPVPFEFYGFLPRRKGERVRYLQDLKLRTAAMVFYESPHRLSAMCSDLCAVFGAQRSVFVVKELTKRFETSWHGPLASICEQLQQANLQGEFVVIVAGADKQKRPDEKNIMVPAEALIAEMVKAGIGVQEVQRVLGAVSTVRKNEIYQYFLACKDATG
jgi:16S rRNA (cytidine1402-2'-O)-methyltransferase